MISGNQITQIQQQKQITRLRKVIQKKKNVLGWWSAFVEHKFSSYLRGFFALFLWKVSGWLEIKTRFQSLHNKYFHMMKMLAIFLSGICEQLRVWGTEKN